MSSSKKSTLLIGPTGAGKSSLGNLLVLHGNFTSITTLPFETSDAAASITRKNSSKESNKYVVIDTLGCNDTEYAQDESMNLLREDLTDAIAKRGVAGIDVIFACFKMGRYTSAVNAGFNYMFDSILGPSASSRTFLVITHCDAKYVNPITAADAQRTWITQSKEQNPAFKSLCDKIQSRILFVCNPPYDHDENQKQQQCREWSLSSLEDTIDQYQPTTGKYAIQQTRQTQERYRKRMEEQKKAEAAAKEAARREAEEKARAEAEARHRKEQARLEAERQRQEAENAAALARAAAEKEAQLQREREEAERRREAEKRAHVRDVAVIGAAAVVAPPVAVVLGIKKLFRW